MLSLFLKCIEMYAHVKLYTFKKIIHIYQIGNPFNESTNKQVTISIVDWQHLWFSTWTEFVYKNSMNNHFFTIVLTYSLLT